MRRVWATFTAGMFLTDDEGEISTVDVNAKFVNGKPQAVEATVVMKSTAEWNRFMRFMVGLRRRRLIDE